MIIPIAPKPYLKIPYDWNKWFRIPERCRYIPTYGRHYRFDVDGPLEDMDVRIMGCELWNNTGFCRHTSSLATRLKRKQLMGYNKYKEKLKILCDERGISLQPTGMAMYFYYPMPVRWSKKKKQEMYGQHKETKPDWDNLAKGVCDALGKRRGDGTNLLPDERVAQVAGVGKFWIREDEEPYIEMLFDQPLYNPFNVTFINQLL